MNRTCSLFSSYSKMTLPKTIKAARVEKNGGVEVIEFQDIPLPEYGPDQLLVKAEYSGVNFIDTYFRKGLYKVPLPLTLGVEVSGEVVAAGTNVKDFKVGDKVFGSGKSYAEYVVLPAAESYLIPEGYSTKDGATLATQGLTALTFVREAHKVEKGDTILIYAAAGGLGLLLVQLAKYYGATVIASASSEEKLKIAKEYGADHVILHDDPDFVEKVFEITGGEGLDRGVSAVFDGIGKDTFDRDLKLVKRKGSIITLGNASGAVAPVNVLDLSIKNLRLLRPKLGAYLYTPEERKYYSELLFSLLGEKKLKLTVHDVYPFTLEGVRKAHTDIESRKTIGKLLIKIA